MKLKDLNTQGDELSDEQVGTNKSITIETNEEWENGNAKGNTN